VDQGSLAIGLIWAWLQACEIGFVSLAHGWIGIGWFRLVTAKTSRFARLQRILFRGSRPRETSACASKREWTKVKAEKSVWVVKPIAWGVWALYLGRAKRIVYTWAGLNVLSMTCLRSFLHIMAMVCQGFMLSDFIFRSRTYEVQLL
jgi:hypothetical protein